jgi:hypothetical protein
VFLFWPTLEFEGVCGVESVHGAIPFCSVKFETTMKHVVRTFLGFLSFCFDGKGRRAFGLPPWSGAKLWCFSLDSLDEKWGDEQAPSYA